MEIVFIQSGHRREPSLVMRDDGVGLTVPVFGPLEPIPHDLAHYVIERELGLEDGFWGTVAAGGVFEGMRIVSGRQRPHARERSQALMQTHHRSILFSELVVDEAIRAVRDEPPGKGFLAVDHPNLRSAADRLALRARLRPAMEEMCVRWRAVPPGGVLTVVWETPVARRGAGPLSSAQRKSRHAGRNHIRAAPYR